MNITIVGTGYVGLVSGVCFAEMGNNVTCVDIDEEKVSKLKSGEITIYEPGLESLFESNISKNRLAFTTNLKQGVSKANVIFLALPTPPNEDGSADLKYILQVAEDLASIITDYKVIVDKSTVPVGTFEMVTKALAKKLEKSKFDVVSNPEFLREGHAVEDFINPDRVVIGTSSDRAKLIMNTLYEPFLKKGHPILFMDEKSAEMTKYAANTYLATRISFMNEIANLCERVGANVDFVRQGMGTDSRIGKRFLFPGIGYGGSCFPKDVRALAKTADENNYDFKIVKSVMEINQIQKRIITEKVSKFFSNSLKGKKIALWGLSFKPNTDDIRDAPALEIIDFFLSKDVLLNVHDPVSLNNVKRIYGDKLNYYENMYNALKDVESLVIATEWSLYLNPDFEKMKTIMKNSVIFDGRNIFSKEMMEESEFYYESIGRPILKRQSIFEEI